jgi:hypothetical protein
LVDGGLIDTLDPDDEILNCYRLADRYHQNPELFIEMPLSRIHKHIRYTIKLIEAQNKARPRDDD